NLGCGYFEVNQRRGVRWNAAQAFLRPVRRRPNLALFSETQACRLRVHGGRCTGVEVDREGSPAFVAARGEVVLAAGAIGSPHLLLLSGIGSGEALQPHGIEVAHELPGVGANLQDHLQLRCAFRVNGARTLNTLAATALGRAGMALQYALTRSGPLTMSPSQLGAFACSRREVARPNLEFHVQPLSLDSFGEPLHRFDAFTVSVCNLRPTARGTVRLRSADPGVPPAIAPNYLTTQEDRAVAVDALRLARTIVAAPALQRLHPEEFRPGLEYVSSEELVQAAGVVGTTIFHPVGTCKMGPARDPMAVVDAQLRVHGVAGLRVIDASVMPAITSGNTNAPTLMIAEKGAQAVIDARGR
ncbi:MAG TPA: GMC oxidoreductase, partial [Burkholderiaceae bacterium]